MYFETWVGKRLFENRLHENYLLKKQSSAGVITVNKYLHSFADLRQI